MIEFTIKVKWPIGKIIYTLDGIRVQISKYIILRNSVFYGVDDGGANEYFFEDFQLFEEKQIV